MWVQISATSVASEASRGTTSPPTSTPASGAITMPGTLRDSLNLLTLVLEQETDLSHV